jgi:metal-responsive CopG/Arc/MetJ family transcriptional regulator
MMHTLSQLEKQQVGLRLPKYLVEEIDAFTREYSLNRTDIIIEAISAYVKEQKAKMVYDNFDTSCKELNSLLSDESKRGSAQSLDTLIDELDDR